MPQSTIGLHHQHKRGRVQESSVRAGRLKKFIDSLIYVMGAIVPIFTIPQAMQVWVQRSAEGVSGITWSIYLLNTIIWTIYGILHKEKRIVFTFSFMTILNVIIVTGIMLFS